MEKDFLTHVDNSALGTLDPNHEDAGATMRIKGVDIPASVLRQLRELGIPIEHFTRGELQDAVLACAIDGDLVDDEHGTSFKDKLTLTKEEEYTRANPQCQGHHHVPGAYCDHLKEKLVAIWEEKRPSPHTTCDDEGLHAHAPGSFCEQVEAQRDDTSAHGGHAHNE